MSEPAWIEAEDLIEFNKLAVAETGEPFALLHHDLLGSSVHRPRQIYHYDEQEDVVALGCALACSIAQNHPFQQGNKRTAHTALFRFLWINGFTFRDPDAPELAELLIEFVEHGISEEDMPKRSTDMSWSGDSVKARIVRRPSPLPLPHAGEGKKWGGRG